MINKIEKLKYLKLIIYLLSALYLIFFIEFQYSPDVNKFINKAKLPLSEMNLLYFNIAYFFTIIIYKILLYLPNWEVFFVFLNFNFFFFTLYNIFFICKNLKVFKEKNNFLFIYIFILGVINYEFSQWIKYGTSDLILIFFITYCFRLFVEKKILSSLITYIFASFIKPQSILFFIYILSNVILKKINYNFFEMINDVTSKIKLNYGVNKIVYLDQNFSKSSQIERQSLKILYDYIAKLDVDIKFHPYMNSTAKFPNCFSLPTFLPSELLCAEKKVVISISSIGLISPSFNNNIKSISLMNLVNFNCINNKKKIFDFLYENSKGKILFPSSFNELDKIILSS